MHSSFSSIARKRSWALPALCAAALLVAGCHSNNLSSGYGITWVTLTDQPGDFTSYIVAVDSITFTRNDSAVVTALATAETVDFAKLGDVAEMWGTATVATGTYLSATITLDYTSADISVLVNGVPQKVTVVGTTGAAVTTVPITVTFDPANPLVITPTYATTAAQRLALDFNVAASTAAVNFATNPPTLTVKPFMTAAISAPDHKLIRVRGPLINSSVGQQTYTVYVRPFYDELNSLGSLTMFNDANTIYTIDGTTYVGAQGMSVLSQTSAGTTITAGYTTYEPTSTPSATAGKFNAKYVIAGSTLEDGYTQGLDGTVISRSGNALVLRGATLSLNDGTSTYGDAGATYDIDAIVNVGPKTIVTADDNATLTGLTYNSIAVGQHVAVRGIYSLPGNRVTIDATGTTNINTGSVRLLSTEAYGTLVSSGTGSLVMDLQAIDVWPVSVFNFAGDGASAAQNPVPASYVVNTGTATVPTLAAGDPLWVEGTISAFGSAPPDFNATVVNAEVSEPASLQVHWASPGSSSPFANASAAGFSIDPAGAHFSSGELVIGAERIDLATLATPALVVPVAASVSATPATVTTPPAAFAPLFAIGNATVGIKAYSVFATYLTYLNSTVATSPALQFEARGSYNRTTNTFTATTVNVVL